MLLLKRLRDPKVEPQVQYYLGRAYHLNYRFQDAINAFNLFKSKVSFQGRKLQTNEQIAAVRREKLLKNIMIL